MLDREMYEYPVPENFDDLLLHSKVAVRVPEHVAASVEKLEAVNTWDLDIFGLAALEAGCLLVSAGVRSCLWHCWAFDYY